MAKGQSFIGELLHANAVRMRVTGSGSLLQFLRSLDDVNNSQLTSLTLQSVTNREPTTLANFIDQRIQFEVSTVVLGETFNVSKIIVFVKPIASSYPQ